ncbi:MAG: hypothetical protein J6E46_13070 [Faecalicoccus sp.]|nr:hypothetical protein [Faecalicoccus sp.]
MISDKGLCHRKASELYSGNEKVSPLATQSSWTNHLLKMLGCKTDEVREFYIWLAIRERYMLSKES